MVVIVFVFVEMVLLGFRYLAEKWELWFINYGLLIIFILYLFSYILYVLYSVIVASIL